ncbi:MAG: AAA family ATPase [Eubacteriales bacterium]|nr:AAA family ATPase [Eubacteriales bacterium]
MKNINIPVGTSSFAEIRQKGYYYIDKTGLIEELMRTPGTKVTLITRPRRFGKTLGMSMMAEFFDIRKSSHLLFEGLSVSKNKELCKTWMNQYPTVFVSFRNVDGLDFEQAYEMLKETFSDVFMQHIYLLKSDIVHDFDKNVIARIAERTASMGEIQNALLIFTRVMSAHYGKPVILLIDEYDVPLAKASAKGYYKEMLSTIRGVMSVLKDNPALNFAIVTGCLQIVKESIFTGTNNFVSDTISDSRLDEYFGFTQADVDKILLDTELTDHTDEIKDWYDGYRFGERDVYCPWDVMNHVKNLLLNPATPPASYWEHTSHNDIIYQFISTTDADVNDKFETLLAGGYIIEPIEPNLTYDVLHSSERNIWTLLYFTGYLTRMRPEDIPETLDESCFALTIPNTEIKRLFRKSVSEWYLAKTEASDRSELFDALWKGDAGRLQEYINDTLFDTISFYDYHENFYHAFLAGQLSRKGYVVKSNRENGLGRSDITVKDRKMRRAVIIETKSANSESELDSLCDEALAQITKNQYNAEIEKSGYRQVFCIGIAFYKKQCHVKITA